MLTRLETLRDSFSPQIFLMGVSGVVAIYAGLFIYAFTVSGSMLEEIERNLASETVMIEDPHSYVEKMEDASVKTTRDDKHREDEDDKTKAVHADQVDLPPKSHHPKVIEAEPAHDESASLSDLLTGENTGHKGLRKAPIDKITEETPQGLVPVKKRNLPTAFEAYRKPFILNKSRHAVAVVIDNFGLSEKLSAAILQHMPGTVSLIISPYSAHANSWQKKARMDGHELWMHLPVQTLDFPRHDPGAKGLLSDASLAYNEERLEWVLSRTSGYSGLASFTDGALGKSAPMFTGFFNQIFDRGLGFLELNAQSPGFAADIAKLKKAPYATSHLHIKSFALNSDEVKTAEEHIKEHQNTIIIVQPNAQNLEPLKNWLMRLENSGLTIAPASALASLATE